MKLKKSYLVGGATALIVLIIICLALMRPWVSKKVPVQKPLKSSGIKQNLLMGLVIKVPGSEPDSYWELKVERFTEQKKIGTMMKVKGDYFLKGKPFYHVVAGGGEINWLSRQLQFHQKVEFSSSDGKKLVAGEFWWDPVHKRMSAEKQVELSAPGFQIYTQKVTADLGLKRVTFIGATRLVHQNEAH